MMRRLRDEEQEMAGMQGMALQDLMGAMDQYAMRDNPKMKRPAPAMEVQGNAGGLDMPADPRFEEMLRRKKMGC